MRLTLHMLSLKELPKTLRDPLNEDKPDDLCKLAIGRLPGLRPNLQNAKIEIWKFFTEFFFTILLKLLSGKEIIITFK